MTNGKTDKITSKGFSQAFEQMCNFIAVAKTGAPRETVKGLVTLCLLVFGDEGYDSAQRFCETIETLLGIVVPIGQIQSALDELEAENSLSRPAGTNYVLTPQLQITLRERVNDANNLEKQVKENWFEALDAVNVALSKEQLWKALRAYLSRTFRRHGIQAAALVDPTIDTSPENEVSLSRILKEAVDDHFEAGHRDRACNHVSTFLAELGAAPERRQYVSQLADGAFNFFLLEVPSDLAGQLRQRLNESVLFLDTNFLFGILDLHYNSQVDVSHELLRAIEAHGLPFKLRYHEATAEEMRKTVSHYGSILRSRQWTRAISRAAAASRNLTGIEQKFHESNALAQIDTDEFLRPFEHFDRMLNEKKIAIYRTGEDRLQARTDLFHDYQSFLKKNGRGEKPYETIMHDATVLDATRKLRTDAKSSLEAGALLISCDYFLYRFDWESARRTNRQACVLLPNIFLQLLRPFMPSDQDFDRAFAETFALPEFRALGSGGAKACSKMLQIMATYKDVPEETAFKMVSNDLLLDRLRTTSDESEFEKAVEAAFVEENRGLLEEKAAIERQLAEAERTREEQERQQQEQEELHAKERSRYEESLKLASEELAEAQNVLKEQEKERDAATEKVQELSDLAARTSAEKEKADQFAFGMAAAAGVAVGILLVATFEFCVHRVPWTWLRDHDNSIGLQAGICAVLLCGSLGSFVAQWRKWCWGTGVVGVAIALLSLLTRGGSGNP